MTTSNNAPYAVHEATQAVLWLLSRHATPRGLVDRLACWHHTPDGRIPDVDGISKAVREYDEYQQLWRYYAERTHEPSDDAAYDRWEAAGPKPPEAARIIGPMSGGEKRMLRMLAVLDSMGRVAFSISDIDGIDSAFRTDWLRVCSGGAWGQ